MSAVGRDNIIRILEAGYFRFFLNRGFFGVGRNLAND
jgi:hypothetical protein